VTNVRRVDFGPRTETGDMTSSQLAELAGITYRQLDFWLSAGYVVCAWADIHPRMGPGWNREWSHDEATFVIRVASLARAGFKVDVASKLAAALDETGYVKLGDGFVLVEERLGESGDEASPDGSAPEPDAVGSYQRTEGLPRA
jgi:hypothetical protein